MTPQTRQAPVRSLDESSGSGALSARLGSEGMTTLHQSEVAIIQRVRCPAGKKRRGPQARAGRFHIVVPQEGAFVWHRPEDDVVADTVQVLAVPAYEPYAITHTDSGDDSLVITPGVDLGQELRLDDPRHAGGKVMSPQLSLYFRMIGAMAERCVDPTLIDEAVIEVLAQFAETQSAPSKIGEGAKRTLNRAKKLISETPPDVITIGGIAAAVGVTPIYLTQLFKRAEGTPLHRYVMSRRLSAAFASLASADDLTTVALDHGFSSHSHFTMVFGAQVGRTPSCVRESFRSLADSSPRVKPTQWRPLCPARSGKLSA
jgi:AraC family transcriptional regulator